MLNAEVIWLHEVRNANISFGLVYDLVTEIKLMCT